jgi:hypothetical protein
MAFCSGPRARAFVSSGNLSRSLAESETRALQGAYQIFTSPLSRAIMGMLVLSKCIPTEIIAAVYERFGFILTEAMLTLYRRVFWDPDMMSRATWPGFVDRLDTKEHRNYITMGLQSPGILEVRHTLGLEVKADAESILANIATEAHAKVQACHGDAASRELRSHRMGKPGDSSSPGPGQHEASPGARR